MSSKLSNFSLNVARIQHGSQVNGPGNRFVVWVQGCTLACRGCINVETWNSSLGSSQRLNDLYRTIVAARNIEGVTYSGGEPFQQAQALSMLSKALRKKGLTVVSYSGYTLEEIRSSGDPHRLDLLSQLDILIDGRYMEDQALPMLWRGSGNQRVHFLAPQYKHYQNLVDLPAGQMEMTISDDGIAITGNLSWQILSELRKRLRAHGVSLRDDHNS